MIFEERPRKVHFHHDQQGATYGLKKTPFANTLCKMNSDVPESHITTDPDKVTCEICRKDHRFAELTQIAPLTEAEADAIFNAPSASDKYIAAMEELKTLPFVDGHIVEDIQGYIRWLLQALNNVNEKYDGLDRYLNRHHDMASKMCMDKAEKQIRADLDATGLPYTLERGTRHLKINLCGYLVGIIPMKGRDNVVDRHTYLDVRSQIRRKAKELK